jgi:hypothetical protein
MEVKEAKSNSGFGKALTALGLEDKFISNGELANFNLSDRGVIANGIISEKLNRGRWESVIEMMYGGVGKADALYDGDRKQLREDIVKSAVQDPDAYRVDEHLVNILKKAGETELLVDLATKLPLLNYENFNQIEREIPLHDYFEKAENGAEKKKAFLGVKGKLAFKEEKYSEAISCFLDTKNQEGIDNFFELMSKSKYPGNFYVSSVEEAALSDPLKRDSRLKALVDIVFRASSKPIEALELQKKYDIDIPPGKMKAIRSKIAKNIERWNLEKSSNNKWGLELSWARQHIQTEPRKAYEIFLNNKHTKRELNSAMFFGLTMTKMSNNEGKTLSVRDIPSAQLEEFRNFYPSLPFDLKKDIARQLKDKKALMQLSKEAKKVGNLDDSYKLFVEAGGNLQSMYIHEVRSKLIKQIIEKDSGVYKIDSADKIGKTELYNQLIETSNGNERSKLSEAYDLARDLNNDKMLSRVRKLMVEFNPAWALMNFKSTTSQKTVDTAGVDYLLSEIAESAGVDKNKLEGLVGKYYRD